MRATLALFLLGLVAVCSAAEDTGDTVPDTGAPAVSTTALVSEFAWGTISLATEREIRDLQHAANLLRVARQQEMHIRRSATLSLIAPGLGHFINGDFGRAAAFASAELLVQVAAGVGGCLLLPAAVKSANLNYLQTPLADIEARWKGLTVSQLLPSAVVAVSGWILSTVVRHLAATDAEAVARERIRSGEITFQP